MPKITFKEVLDGDIFRQLKDQTDRGAAIIGGSMVEYHLERLLLARMKALGNKRIAYLFEGFGPLAGFASKIEIACALNLFGEVARSDMLALNWIRNKFAHEISGAEWTFDHPEVSPKTKELKLWETLGVPLYPDGGYPNVATARGQFTVSVYVLSSQLEGELIANQPPLFSPQFLID